MPVNFHIGGSATSMSWFGSMPWPSFDDERKLALGSLMVMISNFRTIGNLLLSGVLERHPTLQVVSVESGLGWMPFLLEGLDYEVAGVRAAASPSTCRCRRPSTSGGRSTRATGSSATACAAPSTALGADNILFETDFPHPTCLYPDSLARGAEALAGLQPEERRKILSTNAATLYRIPLPGAA